MQDASPVPVGFSIVGTEFVIAQNVDIEVGFYDLVVEITETFTGLVNTGTTFTVEVKCSTTMIPLSTLPVTTTYTINPYTLETTTLTLPTYQQTPPSCASLVVFEVYKATDA